MAYIPSECTIEQYNSAIYDEGAKHLLYLKIGNNVLENPDNYCEKLTWKNLLLDNGSKTFSLDNFVSKEIELIMHNYSISDLTQEITIKLGTYINETIGYVYIPIGVYKIQGNPTTDKNKTTYKLRDRAVNFDFDYNAKTIIDANSGSATKLQILQDICTQAGVTYVGSTTFVGYDDAIGIYDSTVKARLYVSYIAEQAGCIPTINRDGNLTFIQINNNLSVQTLPFDYLESYSIGDSYTISKTIYESGSIYFENGTTTNDILYIDGANPYIANQSQLDRVATLMNGFTIGSFSTGKILGNPAIDCYDFVQFTNSNNETYKTLGQYTLTYSGKMIQTFSTDIDHTARNSNTTKNGESTFKKYVKQEIDNVNATVTSTVGKVETIEANTNTNTNTINKNYNDLLNKFDNYATTDDLTTIENNVQVLQTNTYTKTDINNIISGTAVDGKLVTFVTTTSGKFDDNGLNISKTNEPTNSTYDWNGIDVKRNSDSAVVLKARSDGVEALNLTANNFLIKKPIRMEETTSNLTKYKDQVGLGHFFVGDD